MNSSLMVHYAVACLEALDVPLKPEEVSRHQGVPLGDCTHILRKFESAGLVRENATGLFERTCDIEALTALQVLQALWPPEMGADIRMLYGQGQWTTAGLTRQAVRVATQSRG